MSTPRKDESRINDDEQEQETPAVEADKREDAMEEEGTELPG